MFCSGEVIAAYTNTRMETLVLEMFDKVSYTTNVKTKALTKTMDYKDMPGKSSPIILDMQQDVIKQAQRWHRQTMTNGKESNIQQI